MVKDGSVGIVHSQRSQTLALITTQLNDGASPTVRTVQCSLYRMGFGRRQPTRVPLLNARYGASRLAWAREHRDWNGEEWKRVAWSDESRFRLLNTNGRLRIWRQAHEAVDSVCQVRTVQGLELYMVVQSRPEEFFRGNVWDLWCVYQPPSIQFGT
ncbi:HTH_Tnp_Tc3_2 domain-containing protein [Trichonephila clavipes]|nr:HTH_Tnp_Tc3_2 domain-containing protein [Trichonephila clavipes]